MQDNKPVPQQESMGMKLDFDDDNDPFSEQMSGMSQSMGGMGMNMQNDFDGK